MAEDGPIQESEWFCSKHQVPAKLFCEEHSRAVCVNCALVDHKQCTFRDIGDVIRVNRETLLTLRDKLVNREPPDYLRQICECRDNVDEHLISVKYAVDVACQEKMRRQLENDIQDGAIINQEIDARNVKLREDIRRIQLNIEVNEDERARRHQEKQKLSDDTRSTIHSQQGELTTAIQAIADEIGENISAFERSCQEQTRYEEDARRMVDRTLTVNDETLVAETEQVKASVTDVLGRQISKDTLTQITCHARDVKFIKHVNSEGNDDLGRIVQVDSLENIEEWKCVSSIKVTHEINQPTVVGYMDDGNVIITNGGHGRKDTYVLNTATERIKKVISTTDASYVVSSAMLKDGRVACGRHIDGPPSDRLSGCIIVYDTNQVDACGTQWKELRRIDVRIGKMRNEPADVYVTADREGRIIACQVGQKKIHVVNPETGATLKTINGMDPMVLRGVQSSGYIVAQASPVGRKLYIVKEENIEDTIDTKDIILNASVVPVTNAIYSVTSSRECRVFVIWNTNDAKPNDRLIVPICDRLTDLGNSKKHIKPRKTHIVISRVIFVTPKEMIVSDGESILIHRKT